MPVYCTSHHHYSIVPCCTYILLLCYSHNSCLIAHTEQDSYEQTLSEEAVLCILDFLVVWWARGGCGCGRSSSLVVAGNQDSRVEEAGNQ